MNAWIHGGVVAASMAVQLDATAAVKEAWGKGDERRARALTEVFTMAMASNFYRQWDTQVEHPPEERREARRAVAENILVVFGDKSPTGVEDFLKLDAQYNHDMGRVEHKTGTPLAWQQLLFARALAACRGDETLPGLQQMQLPVDNLDELTMQSAKEGWSPTLNPLELLQLNSAVTSGVRWMYDTYRQVHTP